jgi:hypothetical protein
MTTSNPGPGTKYCPVHGNVWLHELKHISDKPVIKASEDYVNTIHATCQICGALLINKIMWDETENID